MIAKFKTGDVVYHQAKYLLKVFIILSNDGYSYTFLEINSSTIDINGKERSVLDKQRIGSIRMETLEDYYIHIKNYKEQKCL